MRLWIDDVRPAPEGYIWIKSVNKAKPKADAKIVNEPIFLILFFHRF